MYTSRLCSSARIWRPGAHLAPGAYQTCQTRSDLSDPIRPSANLAPRHSSARRRLSGAPALIWRSGAYLALWRSGALALLSAPPKAIRRFGALLNLRRSPESSSAFLALRRLSTVPAQQSMRSTHEFIVLRLFVQRMLASSNLANSFHCILSRFGSLGRRPAPGPLCRFLPTESMRIRDR